MEVKMKIALLCSILLLAGSASCSPVEANNISLPSIDIPDWVLDIIGNLEIPDAIQNIIDRLPEIIAAIPEIIEKIPEIIEQIVSSLPELIPVILERLEEIISQIADQLPDIISTVLAFLERVINSIPELIPVVLEKIPEIIEALPALAERIKEIYDGIREVLEQHDLPDWFPTLPDFDLPESWPEITIPELPEYNVATPGVPSSVDEFPGIVQIEVGTGPIWIQGCVGSVLTNFHILTVARCVTGRTYDNRYRRVRAGSSNRFDGGSIVGVERSIAHPEFTDDSFNADIAVLRLFTNLIFSATIQQTAIVSQGFTLPSQLTVTVAGWGSTTQGLPYADRDLYKIDLVSTDTGSCAERWRLIPLFTITENMICVADSKYGGRNGDIRDIGAPIYYQNALIGLVSLGAPIGNQYFPVVGTSVGSYTNWIVANAV